MNVKDKVSTLPLIYMKIQMSSLSAGIITTCAGFLSFWHSFLWKVVEPCPEGLVLLKHATYSDKCLIIILTKFPLKVMIKGKPFQLSMIMDGLPALFGCLLISFYSVLLILNTTKTSVVQVQEGISS